MPRPAPGARWVGVSGLSERDRAILDFEAVAVSPAGTGAKEEAIRDRCGLGVTAYYQRLNALIDTREALAYAPGLVRRLRRVRRARVRSRRDRSADLAHVERGHAARRQVCQGGSHAPHPRHRRDVPRAETSTFLRVKHAGM
ncbi:uncharacterized protein DUF3263 [Oryzihumus leptocrescens]|uniref:Uncharacterized protein DUF3263 n=1 Tax=Oryzihumus leptocrescens TaxID=297536 RepID=A0A542ZIB4_9MICO|nr:uncharacterized protein DUF3263 [Oryzihumus leptocrescens]